MAKTTEVVVTLRLDDKGAVDRLGALEIETKQYQRELRALNAEIAKNGTATKEQTQQVGRLSASIRSNQTVIRELKNDLSGATAAGLRFRDKMADAAKAGLGAFGLNILSVTGAITGLVSVLRNAVNTLADFDKALSSVSALGGDYAARIDEISEATKTAGIAFGFTAVESVQAVEELAKAGVAVEDILGGGLESALTLAAAGTISVADAAEVAATSMTVFGIAGSDVVRVADALTAGSIKALGGVDDLSNALKFIGPVAANLNVQLEETIGTLALFAQNGIKGEQAGTSLRGVLSSLTSPSKEAAKEMERLGIVTAEGNKLFDERTGKFLGLANLSEQLSVAMKDLTDEERSQALGRIFGNQQVTAANVLYRSGAKDVKFWTAEVTDAGIAAEVAAAKTDSLQGDLNRLDNAYKAVILEGDVFTDMLRGLTKASQVWLQVLSGPKGVRAALEDIVTYLNRDITKKVNSFIDVASQQTLLRQRAAVQVRIQQLKELGDGTAAAEEEILKLSQVYDQLTVAINRTVAEEQRALTQTPAVIAGAEAEKVTVASLREELTRLKAEREALTATDVKSLKANAAQIAAIEAQLSVIDGKEKAVKKLTAAQKEQLAIAKEFDKAVSGQGTTGKDAIAKPLQSLEVPLDEKALEDSAKIFLDAQEALRIAEIKGTADFNLQRLALDEQYFEAKTIGLEEYNAKVAALQDAERQQQLDNQNLAISAAGQFVGALSDIAEQGSAEYKALATAQALINTYLGATQALAQGVLVPPFVKIIQAAAIIASGLASVKQIQGFATGGVVQGGQPIQRDNGDNVLITAKRGEVILNETQQQRLVRLYGDDLFRRAGVPGFAGGGLVRSSGYTFTKSTGIIPSPSPRDLLAVESNAIARNTNFSPVVSVVEINRLQERVRVIEQLATG